MQRGRSSASLAILLGLAGVFGASGVALASDTPRASSAPAYDDPHAVALLRQAAQAMRETSYSGTRTVTSWGESGSTTMVLGVEHVAGQGTSMVVQGGGHASGAARFLAARESAAESHGLTARSLQLLTETYDVRSGGAETVTGRLARVVQVYDADDLLARLWIDESSGLLVRRDLYDADGRLATQSVFFDVELLDRPFLTHLPPAVPHPAGHGVSTASRGELQSDGWHCPGHVGSLSLVGLELLDSPAALHLDYSDGLTRVSVFEQRGRLDPAAVQGYQQVQWGDGTVYVREGLPSHLVWEQDGVVLTAVTDGPVDRLLERLDPAHSRESAEWGFWARVGAGISRMTAWAGPLT